MGTVRMNRKGLPTKVNEFMKKEAKKSDMSVLYSHGMSLTSWRDKKPVNILSSVHFDFSKTTRVTVYIFRQNFQEKLFE